MNFLEQRTSPGPPISERTTNPGNNFKDPGKLEMGAKKGGSEEKEKFHWGGIQSDAVEVREMF